MFHSTYAQHTANVNVSISVEVGDATNFITSPGIGSCDLSWKDSLTPNVDDQEIITYLWDDGTSTKTFVSSDFLGRFLGPGINDAATMYGLTPGLDYVFTHISHAGTLASPGIDIDTFRYCTPTDNPANPAPILDAEPATTVGTSNTLSFVSGGGLFSSEHNISVSTEDLAINPSAAILNESGWLDSADPAWGVTPFAFIYTFTPLTTGQTYYYHVQTRIQTWPGGPMNPMVWEYSPYSNVEFSTQTSSGGGHGGTPPPPPPPPATCGDGNNDAGEECDDGNTISGDGCSASCVLEVLTSVCGDNVVEGSETCDDGNMIDGDGCSAACQIEIPIQVCGNGIVEIGEECDDGNTTSGDGCSNLCENELVEVTFHIQAKPEFRAIIDSTPNLDMSSILGLADTTSGDMAVHNTVAIDDFGLGTYTIEMPPGTYDAGLNGEAHLTKIIRDIQITETTTDVTLDFTFGDTVELLAGDVQDNNFVNAMDLAALLQDYQTSGDKIADLNNQDYVNALDLAILLKNYFKPGEDY